MYNEYTCRNYEKINKITGKCYKLSLYISKKLFLSTKRTIFFI